MLTTRTRFPFSFVARTIFALLLAAVSLAAQPRMQSELVFPLEHWHNHSSSVVELPDGDLLVVWYNGSGERTADDVKIEGSRWSPKTRKWSERFLVADVPNFPDCNPILWVDPQKRLWLFWPTIVANEWHTSILQYRVTKNYPAPGKDVRWDDGGVILFEPQNFEARVKEAIAPLREDATNERAKRYIERIESQAGDKYARRMGWMPRNHPIVIPPSASLPKGRYILPLYSDGFSFSMVAYSDDEGKTWLGSEPLIGRGAVQPSIVRKRNGDLLSYYRDNGPAPKRVPVSESKDNGVTWSIAQDTELFNSGTSMEVIALQSGEWLMVNNDTERGRQSLVLALSDDEGKTWKWQRHIELDKREKDASSFHYPSIIQAANGDIHLTYSLFLNHIPKDQPRKSIKHAVFNVDWVKAGD